MWLPIAGFALAALLTAAPASAQGSAQGSPAHPPEPSNAQASEPQGTAGDTFVEKARRYIKEKRIVERLSPRDGFYPRVGGMTTGSGMALGVGYRRHLFADRLFTDASGVISIKNYKSIDLQARWLKAWDDRIELWTNYRYESFPEEDFFGIGSGAVADARTSYKIAGNDITSRALVHVKPWLTLGGDLGYYSPKVGHGFDAALPSVEERFTDAQAPGLDDQPNFMHHSVFAEADTRDVHGRPSRGGFYHASFTTWDDTTLQQFNFRRFDGEAARFIPLAGARQVLALRVGASYVDSADTDRVPFYFLPYLGGSDTVRGLVEFRYRDENIAFINGEYRLGVHKYLDVVPFFDAGKVGHDWHDINLQKMKTAYGIGVRAHSDTHVFFRTDLATGSGEGTNVFMKFGTSF